MTCFALLSLLIITIVMFVVLCSSPLMYVDRGVESIIISARQSSLHQLHAASNNNKVGLFFGFLCNRSFLGILGSAFPHTPANTLN